MLDENSVMKYIKVQITEAKEGYYKVHNLESTMEDAYELNRLIHSLAMTQIIKEKSKGFTYTFPFNLS